MFRSLFLRLAAVRLRRWPLTASLAGLVLLLVCFALFPSREALSQGESGDYQSNRAKLIGYTLREQLTRNHYSHKVFDDALSLAAFNLYLKQLDGQKRFLLQSDVARLRQFATHIDEEINSGVIELPAVAATLMGERVVKVRNLVHTALAEPFDVKFKGEIETDPDKLDFCASDAALLERWRKVIRLQLATRFLNLQEEQPKEKGAAKSDEALLAEAREKIAKSYEQFFARILEEREQDHYDRYFNAVTRAFDPHTDYMPPTEKEDFDISMRGSLEGIGATLSEEDGYIKVVQVIPGSAAWRQGKLQAEDIILRVAEGKAEPVDISDMRLRDAVSLIRGKKGSEVRLTVKKPDGATIVIPIIRDVVQIEDTFVKSVVLPDASGNRRYGYLRIPTFYRDFQGDSGRNATDDTRRELEKLSGQQISGLIVDLRDNGGGALTDAVNIAGLFIAKGPIVQVRNSDARTEVLDDDEPSVAYAGPLVVLVNEFSASASEILAAALQDYQRAIVIGGTHTHGKGTVQAMLDLDRAVPFRNMDQYKPLGALKLTIQKFYRVSGGSTQYRGVIPDIVLPDRLQYLKSGEQFIEYSLPWDTIAPTGFNRWSQPLPDPSWLAARSRERVAHDPQWIEIAKGAERAKLRSEQTRRSLSLDDLRKERAEERQLAETTPGALHGDLEGAADPDKPKPPLSEADKLRKLVGDLQKDATARESMAILGDLITGKPGPFSASAAKSGRPQAATAD